jgi:hypothetical protein
MQAGVRCMHADLVLYARKLVITWAKASGAFSTGTS